MGDFHLCNKKNQLINCLSCKYFLHKNSCNLVLVAESVCVSGWGWGGGGGG